MSGGAPRGTGHDDGASAGRTAPSGTASASAKRMLGEVDRREVQRLVAEGAQLVDVRDREDYEAFHIAGAISIPLKALTADALRTLDRSRPVVVYCHDFQ